MFETITFNCKTCGAPKTLKKCVYERQFRVNGVLPSYCSKVCVHAGRKIQTAMRREAQRI